jgi:cytochrome b561
MIYAKAAYSATAASLHWLTAIPVVGCVGCVMKAQNSPKEEVGTWMHRHKSLGLLSAMIVAPRLAYRVFNMSAVRLSTIHLVAGPHLAFLPAGMKLVIAFSQGPFLCCAVQG